MAVQWWRTQRDRVVTTVYRRVVLMAHDLEPLPEIAAADPIRLGWLEPRDLTAYGEFRPEADRRQIEQRFARGDQVCAAWLGNRIVHAAWIATGRGPAPYLQRELVLGNDEAMIYDSFTAATHRRRGVTRARMGFIVAELRRRRHRRCWCIVAVENRVGFDTLCANGYRPMGRYAALGLGRWRACWPSGDEAIPALAPLRYSS